jgi:seryl-tRNA synthetase
MDHTVELSAGVPEEIAGDFLSKLYYVSEAVESFEFATPARDRLRFALKPGNDSAASEVSARIATIAKTMTRAYRPGGGKTLVQRPVKVPFSDDPHPLLEARGDLHRYGSGRYALGPGMMNLVSGFDRRLTQLSREFEAVPHQFPSIIGADTLERCRYYQAFPHSLSLVSHLREDLEAIQAFRGSAKWNGSHLDHAPGVLSGASVLLAPAVCFHYYAWLQDTVQEKQLTAGAIGKCFRYESGNLRGLERLWDFTMREIIFLGSRDHVLGGRQRALDATTAVLDEWEMAYEIKSANDPFFIDEFSTQATFQVAFDLKFEIRATLPYKDSSLAAGSFNFHQDFFGRSFNIRQATGEASFTGCIAFGLERLALAFLAQYGLDSKRWPDSVAREVRR